MCSLLVGLVFLLTFYPLDCARPTLSKLVENNFPKPTDLLLTCQEQTGASAADIEALKVKKLPQTRTGKCMLECIFTNVKMIDNGKFNKFGMIAVFSPATRGDITKIGKLKEFADVCEKEIGNQNLKDCETAGKVLECVANNGKKYGFMVGNH